MHFRNSVKKTHCVFQIGVAERVDAIVEMKQPGVWIFGSISDRDRQQGMGIVVEYADQKGEPRWIAPAREPWDYGIFGKTQIPPDPDGKFELVFRKIPVSAYGLMAGQSMESRFPIPIRLLSIRENAIA